MMSAESAPSAETPSDELDELRETLRIQQCVIDVLIQQIPKVNDLMVTSFEQISSEFLTMADKASGIRSAAEKLESDEANEINEMSASISQSIGQLIMSMQFQDRVSQNLVILENVLSAMGIKMATSTAMSSGVHIHHESAIQHARDIISLLNLGEIKQPFVDGLIRGGIIDDGSEVGYIPAEDIASSVDDDDDDIELF